MTEFEKRVKGKFAENNITGTGDFCKKIKVSNRALIDIFRREDCKLSLLLRMCDVLNCSLYDLTGR